MTSSRIALFAAALFAAGAGSVAALDDVQPRQAAPYMGDANQAAQAVKPAAGIIDTSQVPKIGERTGFDPAPQELTGLITEIDAEKGTLRLASPTGELQLHYPPDKLANLKKGDEITAQFSIAKATTTGSVRAYDAPQPAMHQMKGTITDVDYSTGWLGIQSDNTNLRLLFPAGSVQDLKQGQAIAVDLGLRR